MKETTKKLLKMISDWTGTFKGAYNIREDGGCAGRKSSENIKIESKTDKPGLDIHILPGTIGESVYIPACVTHGNVDDLVYNDFMSDGMPMSSSWRVRSSYRKRRARPPQRHSPLLFEPGARVKYVEKQSAPEKGRVSAPSTGDGGLSCRKLGSGDGYRPDRGVDHSVRKTTATVAAGAKLLIRERLLTENEQEAETFFRWI
jgi:hypothetical protein